MAAPAPHQVADGLQVESSESPPKAEDYVIIYGYRLVRRRVIGGLRRARRAAPPASKRPPLVLCRARKAALHAGCCCCRSSPTTLTSAATCVSAGSGRTSSTSSPGCEGGAGAATRLPWPQRAASEHHPAAPGSKMALAAHFITCAKPSSFMRAGVPGAGPAVLPASAG